MQVEQTQVISMSARLDAKASTLHSESVSLNNEAEDQYKLALIAIEEQRKLRIQEAQQKSDKENRYKEYSYAQRRIEDLEEQVKQLQLKIVAEQEGLRRTMESNSDFEGDYTLVDARAYIEGVVVTNEPAPSVSQNGNGHVKSDF